MIRAHWRNGDWSLARVAAHNLLTDAGWRADPWIGPPSEDATAWLTLLARVEVRLGRPSAARAAADALPADAGWEAAVADGEAWLAAGEPYRARDALQRAIDAHRSRPVDAADPERRRAVAHAEVQLGIALADASRAAGHAEEAVATALRALTWAEQVADPAQPDTQADLADALHTLGQCRHAAGRADAAKADLTRALDVRRSFDPHHPDVAATLDALGAVARARGRAPEAVRYHRDALALWTARLPHEPGPASACRQALAQALHRTGDFLGARDEMARSVAGAERALGPDHVDTWIARFELGRFELDTGLVSEGIGRMEAARAAVSARLGRDHPVIKAMNRWL